MIVWEDRFETSEMIHFVPSQFILQVLKRQKNFKLYPHTGQKQIATSPGPLKLKENSRYSPEFVIEVGLNKYLWHQPLERQVAMFAIYGHNVKSQTLFEQIDLISWYLKPVFRKIIAFIHSRQRRSLSKYKIDLPKWPDGISFNGGLKKLVHPHHSWSATATSRPQSITTKVDIDL